MSFEERIERLTKRQEDLDRQMVRIRESIAAIAGPNDARPSQVDERLAQMMERIARLLAVAEAHQQR